MVPPLNSSAMSTPVKVESSEMTINAREMMKKIFAMEKGHFIAYMAEKEGIPAHITENIFWSIINGSMAVNKKIGWCKNTDWYELQLQLLRFTMYGLEGLGEVGKRPCVGETGSQE